MRIFTFSVFSLLFIQLICSQNVDIMKVKTVSEVDIDRYMGVWYEIARFPHRFEKDLVGVTATYKKRPDGKISVLNQGFKYSLSGKHKKAHGKARIPDPSESGRLQVTFFLWFWADYRILRLDTDYQYVLVGSSTPDYLWILCRTPKMDEAIYTELVKTAKEMGYDVSRLERVLQE